MAIYKVRKRNGAIASFDISKIELAIKRAFEATGATDVAAVSSLAKKVAKEVERKIGDEIPSVETIQDLVEEVLIKEEHVDVAKAYIIYRQKRAESRADKNVVVEVGNTMDEYLYQSDWRVNANSNQGYSL